MLQIFLLFTIFFTVKCSCPDGDSGCEVTLVQCQQEISFQLPLDYWQYLYIPLDGNLDIIELEFETFAVSLMIFYTIEPMDLSLSRPHFSYEDMVPGTIKGKPSARIPVNMRGGNLIIGINHWAFEEISDPNIRIRNVVCREKEDNQGQELKESNKMPMEAIIGVSFGSGIIFIFAVFLTYRLKRKLGRSQGEPQVAVFNQNVIIITDLEESGRLLT